MENTNARYESHACLTAHGHYDSLRFVLRLSPVVRERVDKFKPGMTHSELDFEDLIALSTYLHENIHWWQHVGSTSGFLSSLSYPLQTQANYVSLKDFLEKFGPQKPIRRFAEQLEQSGHGDPTANTIVNNFYDLKFFRELIITSEAVEQINRDTLFESFGHSLHIGYGNVLKFLASNFDPEHKIIPDPDLWEAAFEKLRLTEVTGHYHGSPMHAYSIGNKEIFEGQARFAQLQFLHFGVSQKFDFEDAYSRGMLSELYTKAFEYFLRVGCLPRPTTLSDPIVGLFLFVCDMAINPAVGFPLNIECFESFIDDVVPSARFISCCRLIGENPTLFSTFLSDYTFEEYIDLGNIFAVNLHLHNPWTVADSISGFAGATPQFAHILQMRTDFSFDEEETLIKVLTAQLIAFNTDKALYPEVFCWPGKWMSGDSASSNALDLFHRHSAFFQDKEEDASIFARHHDSIAESSVTKVFNLFYSAVVLYQVINQWICEPGKFEFNFDWLMSKESPGRMEQYGKLLFEKTFGINPDNFSFDKDEPG